VLVPFQTGASCLVLSILVETSSLAERLCRDHLVETSSLAEMLCRDHRAGLCGGGGQLMCGCEYCWEKMRVHDSSDVALAAVKEECTP